MNYFLFLGYPRIIDDANDYTNISVVEKVYLAAAIIKNLTGANKVQAIDRAKTPIVSFFYEPIGFSVDIAFSSVLGVKIVNK